MIFQTWMPHNLNNDLPSQKLFKESRTTKKQATQTTMNTHNTDMITEFTLGGKRLHVRIHLELQITLLILRHSPSYNGLKHLTNMWIMLLKELPSHKWTKGTHIRDISSSPEGLHFLSEQGCKLLQSSSKILPLQKLKSWVYIVFPHKSSIQNSRISRHFKERQAPWF